MDPNPNNPTLEPCDLCGGTDLRAAARDSGFTIYRCRACGLVQVRPLPAETREVNQVYWHVDVTDPAILNGREGTRDIFEHGLRCLEKLGISIAGKKLLDVGCGTGLFLEMARERGAVVHGQDLAPEAVEFTRRHCGIDTVSVGYFETSDLPAASFDIVTGWGVLHHTRGPSQWIAQAHRLLADGGTLLLKIPNVSFTAAANRLSGLLKALGFPVTHYLASQPPLNLYGFTRRTLRGLLEKNGFEVLTIERSLVRKSMGLKGALATAATTVATGLTLGRTDFHPVLLAVARKPAAGKGETP